MKYEGEYLNGESKKNNKLIEENKILENNQKKYID